ncbi:hypothetical protein GCM10028857_24450 [Salinarchaeum chitinilyticum]
MVWVAYTAWTGGEVPRTACDKHNDPTMRATRRNVLVILGVLTIVGGALFGTGAFTQVSADRSVTAETVSDSNANLQLSGDGDYVSESGDGTIEFTFDSLNKNASTEFADVLTVTPSPADSSGTYDIYVESATDLGAGKPMDIQDGSGNSVVNGTNVVTADANAGESANLTFVFNTDDAANAPDEITIVAEEQ